MEAGFLGGGYEPLGSGGPRMRFRRDVVEDMKEVEENIEEEIKELEHEAEEALAPVAETLHVAPWWADKENDIFPNLFYILLVF